VATFRKKLTFKGNLRENFRFRNKRLRKVAKKILHFNVNFSILQFNVNFRNVYGYFLICFETLSVFDEKRKRKFMRNEISQNLLIFA
jgi:hypothetical protein